MRKLVWTTIALLALSVAGFASQITFTFLNFNNATFGASQDQLMFGGAINVLVTNNSNGDSMTLAAVDSGNTGHSTHFDPGPPLIVDYLGSGANSVLIESGSHVFLAGSMEDSGRLEAEYPDRAGAFLSRFNVSFVDPAVLAALGSSTKFAPEGSVSLTVADTSFDGMKLDATLGGGSVTIETVAPVPELSPIALIGSGGFLLTVFYLRRNRAKI